MLLGGLRPGNAAQQLDSELKGHLLHHWQQVRTLTGQPFNLKVLDRQGWKYDTELPCRAVVTMRTLAPEDTLAFFTTLQRGFYLDGKDVTDIDVYPSLLEAFAVDSTEFLDTLGSDTTLSETYQDFREVRHLGIYGFPSLLFDTGTGIVSLSHGYQPVDRIQPILEKHLQGMKTRLPQDPYTGP
jgi:putative protein-disulfide isomerase